MIWIVLITTVAISIGAASRAYKRHLDVLTGPWIMRAETVMSNGFENVCVNCERIGVKLDFSEGAALSTPIKCHHCGSIRGTLGSLRILADSGRHDITYSGLSSDPKERVNYPSPTLQSVCRPKRSPERASM